MKNSVESFNEEFIDSVKLFEGNIDYQQTVSKTFVGEKFMPRFDSESKKWIVGYGHKIEGDLSDYKEGISVEEADALLFSDLKEAYNSAEKNYFDFKSFSPMTCNALSSQSEQLLIKFIKLLLPSFFSI